MSQTDAGKFKDLDFASFKELAKDQSLSPHEKIGFPDSYRAGKETDIFAAIQRHVPNLTQTGRTVIDIGPGCGTLAHLLIDQCTRNEDRLILIDSEEMLSQLPEAAGVIKIPAYYPDECAAVIEEYAGKADVVLVYSVLHYVFAEGNLFKFLDATMSLLAVGGQCLIGDIPNISQRKRFFSSPTGVKFHQEFMKTSDRPVVEFNRIELGEIDDSVLISLMLRARHAGFDAYVLPQDEQLPMANRREDLLIKRP